MPTRVPSILEPSYAGSGVNPPTSDTTINQVTMHQMLAQMDILLAHTHSYTDDYGTACNCNCACDCNCTRGTL